MYEARLKKQYREKALPQLKARFAFKNDMQVPRVQKVVVNMGVGGAVLVARRRGTSPVK